VTREEDADLLKNLALIHSLFQMWLLWAEIAFCLAQKEGYKSRQIKPDTHHRSKGTERYSSNHSNQSCQGAGQDSSSTRESDRERMLFIGTQFSILYTFMYSPA
jgi:hypothetical protein